MNLIDSLRKFDGKRTVELQRLSDSLPRNDNSVAQLLAVANHNDTMVQVASTWLLKRWLEEGVTQVEESAGQLVRLLKHANYWEVRLHLLQMLATLRVPARSLLELKKLLPSLLTDDNKFVRAWALSALAAIADQSEALRREVVLMIQDAEADEAASVRARIRQIQKRYKWTTQTDRPKQ